MKLSLHRIIARMSVRSRIILLAAILLVAIVQYGYMRRQMEEVAG